MNLFEREFTWNNREHFLYQLSHRAQIQFGLFCAYQVKHLMKDKRSLKALEVTQAFLDGKATKEDCNAAAATIADAAAYAAVTAAYAADAAVTAAYAADAAATAATYTATAADAYAKEQLKQEQLHYLRELILESLSPEDRECWLLVASF